MLNSSIVVPGNYTVKEIPVIMPINGKERMLRQWRTLKHIYSYILNASIYRIVYESIRAIIARRLTFAKILSDLIIHLLKFA
jgi:hypothetical protein